MYLEDALLEIYDIQTMRDDFETRIRFKDSVFVSSMVDLFRRDELLSHRQRSYLEDVFRRAVSAPYVLWRNPPRPTENNDGGDAMVVRWLGDNYIGVLGANKAVEALGIRRGEIIVIKVTPDTSEDINALGRSHRFDFDPESIALLGDQMVDRKNPILAVDNDNGLVVSTETDPAIEALLRYVLAFSEYRPKVKTVTPSIARILLMSNGDHIRTRDKLMRLSLIGTIGGDTLPVPDMATYAQFIVDHNWRCYFGWGSRGNMTSDTFSHAIIACILALTDEDINLVGGPMIDDPRIHRTLTPPRLNDRNRITLVGDDVSRGARDHAAYICPRTIVLGFRDKSKLHRMHECLHGSNIPPRDVLFSPYYCARQFGIMTTMVT